MKVINLFQKFFVVVFVLKFALFLSQSVTFVPYFKKDTGYILTVNSSGYMQSAVNVKYHETDIEQQVELKYLGDEKDKQLYSWKILSYKYANVKDCYCNKFNLYQGLVILFSTDSAGRFLSLENVKKIPKQLEQRYTEKELSTFFDDPKDGLNYKSFFYQATRETNRHLVNFEADIKRYFLYYGSKFKNAEENIRVKRRGFPFPRVTMPVTVDYTLKHIENLYLLELHNKFDATDMKRKDWRLLAGNDIGLNDLKKVFDADIQERYYFSENSGNVKKIEVKIFEKTSWHNNSNVIQKFSIELH